MKIITIGDVHGRNNWKNFLYSLDKNDNYSECLIGKTIDKVVFIGDYVDSYDVSNSNIISNLEEILNLKSNYPDNVVLLWGNHDVAYFKKEGNISGFRPEISINLYDLFNSNRDLFQLSYQIDNIIWTHAGIHKGWWEYEIVPYINNKKMNRFNKFLEECENISEYLNLMFNFNYEPIFMVSRRRGGNNKVGGPLWVDKFEIYNKPIENYHQIVGHTPVKTPITYQFKGLTKVTFCDCLSNDKFYSLNI